MSALNDVLQHPHSLAARRALADAWRLAEDPRARFIHLQLKDHAGLGPNEWHRVPDEIDELIRKHGKEWAGPLASLVRSYTFHLGLVSAIALDGETWVQRASELVEMAPIVKLHINPPMDLCAVASTKPLLQVRALSFLRGESITDDGIAQFAASSNIANLRTIHLAGNKIGPRGMAALMRSPYLRDVIYITVTGNPGVSTPGVVEVEGGKYILGPRGKELLGAAIDATAFGYSGQVEWPPAQSTFLFDNDG